MIQTKDKMTQVNFKISEKDKKEVAAIFNYYGLDLSTGIKMYLKEVQHTQSIPLQLKPTSELEKAILQANKGEFAGEANSLEEFDKMFDEAMNDED